MKKTVSERIARVIRDLETLRIISDETLIGFIFEEDKTAYHVNIELKVRRVREETEEVLKTIQAVFKREFSNKMFDATIYAQEYAVARAEFECFISAD